MWALQCQHNKYLHNRLSHLDVLKLLRATGILRCTFSNYKKGKCLPSSSHHCPEESQLYSVMWRSYPMVKWREADR